MNMLVCNSRHVIVFLVTLAFVDGNVRFIGDRRRYYQVQKPISFRTIRKNLESQLELCLGKFLFGVRTVDNQCHLQCINESNVCDGTIDCNDGSDEMNCPDADCSITTPGVYIFGSECQYMCHCKNGERCDSTTGKCTSGCDQYWFGPGCQYRDLAEYEYSRHSGNLVNSPVQYAPKGNDGDISTCSYTTEANGNTVIPWWRVTLENEVTITDIYILTTRDGLQYFREFEVTVEKLPYSNKVSQDRPPDTSLCYKHDNTIPDSTNIHVTCTTPLIGNQVRITLSERKYQLIVCDFRINRGRNLGFRQSVTASTIYGNSNIHYQALNAVNGLVSNTELRECFATGIFSNKWLQVEFEQLLDVYYFNVTTLNGRNDYIRSYKIYDTTSVKELLHDSGSDLSPATHGYLNKNLQKITIEKATGDIMVMCEFELYGDCSVNQCGYDCSNVCHCKSIKSLEDKISGICTSGCEDRWRGENGKCDIEWCANNKWGTSCQNECGACRQRTCDFVTGKCTGGCQDGYYNNDGCKTECVDGYYGFECRNRCTDKCLDVCNKEDGVCLSCTAGWTGSTCESKCPAGTHGPNCNEQCNNNCVDICDRVTGQCLLCKDGWQGDHCKQECEDGSYGNRCENKCTDKCLIPCNKVNGVCTLCQAGLSGLACEYECPAGTHGPNCNEQCNKKCLDICDRVTGKCTQCIDGWQGDFCDKAEGESSSSGLIAAIAGSSSAIVVVIILVTIVCIIWLRKRLSLHNQSDIELTNRQGNISTTVADNEGAYWADLQKQGSTQTTTNNAQENANDYEMVEEN